MKILVCVAKYPDLNNSKAMMFVHVRNKYYSENNIEVTVLSFEAKNNYIIDNIPVITLNEYNISKFKCNLLLCHAPKSLFYINISNEIFD